MYFTGCFEIFNTTFVNIFRGNDENLLLFKKKTAKKIIFLNLEFFQNFNYLNFKAPQQYLEKPIF